MRQRLAAIMAADIAEYSRLMEADQAATVAALRVFRQEILRPAVAAHSGELIKDMGDGWLAEFASVSDAVACALSVQKKLSDESVLRLRIGVNVGDVVREAEDIFGDGVNLAARLQSIAPPGGIALSGSARDILDGTLAPAFSDVGVHELKNISRPVRVWMYAPKRAGSAQNAQGLIETTFKLTKLVIRPIESAMDEALADLARSITGDLLRLLNSSDWIGPRVTSSDDEADYAFSGVLRERGGQLRLEVKLLTAMGDAVWSDAFEGRMSESFEWQDSVSLKVASNVFGAITDTERGRLFSSPVEDLGAKECLECSVLEFFEISPESLSSALHYVDRAITLDPDYAPAYAHGVRCLLAALAVGYRNRLREWLEKLPDWLSRAECMQGSTIRLAVCSAIWTYIQRRDEALLRETVSDLLAKAPFDPDLLCLGGWSYVWLGEPARAIECFRKFEQVGRFNALAMAMRAGLATAMVQAERDAAAAEQARTIIANTREFAVPLRALAAALAHQGKRADAREAANEALRLNPGDTLSAFQKRSGFIDNEPNRRFFDGLRAAGYPDG